MNRIPDNLQRYFWDTTREAINLQRHRRYVIERLLEFGDEHAIRWARQTYGDGAIKQVVCRSRNLSRRTCNFWRLILKIPKENIACLSKRSARARKPYWRN